MVIGYSQNKSTNFIKRYKTYFVNTDIGKGNDMEAEIIVEFQPAIIDLTIDSKLITLIQKGETLIGKTNNGEEYTKVECYQNIDKETVDLFLFKDKLIVTPTKLIIKTLSLDKSVDGDDGEAYIQFFK
jgi:hypothetical protein